MDVLRAELDDAAVRHLDLMELLPPAECAAVFRTHDRIGVAAGDDAWCRGGGTARSAPVGGGGREQGRRCGGFDNGRRIKPI